MQVDALTLAALSDELRPALVGARVQEITQPTPHAVALRCWKPAGAGGWLLVSAHPQLAHLHLSAARPRKLGVGEPPAFVMLLRKHLEGAHITGLRQPPWERLLEIGLARGGGDGESAPVATWLVIELMGRLSNIILRDAQGTVLGALRLVGADVNRYRTLEPHAPYRYPPPQTRPLAGGVAPRLDPARVSGSALAEAAREALRALPTPITSPRRGQAGPPLVGPFLAAQVMGWSRELGHEVAVRALGDPEAPLAEDAPWEPVAAEVRALATLATTQAWQPALVRRPEDGVPVAYAVYAPRQYAGLELLPVASVNLLLGEYYAAAEWQGALDGAKAALRQTLRTHHERALRKDEALRAELAALDEAQRLRTEADVLLAFQMELAAGQTSYTTVNPFSEASEPITIALDPRLDAVGNANRRYARYHKLQRAAAQIPTQIAANQIELARIAQVLTDLALAESLPEIAQVRAEVAEAGYLRDHGGQAAMRASGSARARGSGSPSMRGNNPASGKHGTNGKGSKGSTGGRGRRAGDVVGAPLRRQATDGVTLLVGKNSRQNEEVTFRQAAASDLWLHARGVPGAHVIIKSGGRPVSEATLREAAALAAYYSQARAASSVPVDVTEQRYVRHLKGGGPGLVTYERERTLRATPADAASAAP